MTPKSDSQSKEQPIEPVDPKQRHALDAVMEALDNAFNPGATTPQTRKVGLVLLTFPLGKLGRCNYVSNGASHEDTVRILRDLVEAFDQTEACKDWPGSVM